MGGKSYVSISTAELQSASPSFHFEVTEVVAISCRSTLCKKLQTNGILLRIGEHLLVTSESNEHQVIKVSQFLLSVTLIDTMLRDNYTYGLPTIQFTHTVVTNSSTVHHM